MTFHFFCHLLCVKTVYFGPDSKLITLFLHVSKGFCISPSIIMNHYGPNRKLWTSSKVHLQKCSVFFTSHNFYFTFSDWILNYTHTSPAGHCDTAHLFFPVQYDVFPPPLFWRIQTCMLRGCNVFFLLFWCCSAEQTDPKEKSHFKLNLNDPPSS